MPARKAHFAAACIGAAAGAEVLPHRTPCLDAFWRNRTEYAACSGGITGSRSQWDISSPEEELAHFGTWAAAYEQVLACWRAAGRYWQVRMRGVCAPAVCGREEVWQDIYPHLQYQQVGDINGRPKPAEPDPGWIREIRERNSAEYEFPRLKVRELSHWSRLPLDFVIAGLAKCGTTSLHLNLNAHPEIGFTSLYEDSALTELHRSNADEWIDILPPRRLLDEFARRWTSGRPRLLGLNDPGIFRDARIRAAIFQIPNIRILVSVCDPVDRFERFFFDRYFCHDHRTARLNEQFGECHPSIAPAVADPLAFRYVPVAHHLQRLQAEFRDRLWVVHLESMVTAAQATYDQVARFLGAAPFPSNTTFGRYNAGPLERTDLCSSPPLVQRLSEGLESEYEAVLRVLALTGSVPWRLLLRRNRCDGDNGSFMHG